MPGVGYLTYKDKEILYIDYRNVSEGKEFQNVFKAAHKIIMETPENSDLILIDLREALLNYTILQYFFGEETKIAVSKQRKGAVLGIDDSKKIIFDEYNKKMDKRFAAFDSEEEALEYLVSN